MPRTRKPQTPAKRRAPTDTLDWYDHPLWYDIVHWPGTHAEVDGLEAIERRFCLPNPDESPVARRRRKRVWLEPACGSGRYLRVAAARGRAVVGIDLNPKMIAYARAEFRKRALTGDLRVGDMTKIEPPKKSLAPHGADFAFCLINSIRHLPNDKAMLAHLRSMWESLRPGGVYCVGMGLTHYGAEFPSEAVFKATRAGVRVIQMAQFIPPTPGSRDEPILNHLTVSRGGAERHHDNTYNLRCYSGKQWAAILRKTKWEVVGVVDEEGHDAPMLAGDRWQRPDVAAYGLFVLRKPLKKT